MGNDKRFELLLDGANQFCEAVGLRQNLVLDIYRAASDWAFIIQIDALLETAVKDVVGGMICLEVNGKRAPGEGMDEFVRSLAVNGKSSLTKLLRAAGCDKDLCTFIEAVRRLRNVFAHDIRQVDAKLLDVIERHQEGGKILKALCPIEQWDEAVMKEQIRGTDGGLLRFCILDYTLLFLTTGYHVAIKRRGERG